MRRGSATLQRVLEESPFTISWCADVYYGGQRILRDAPITGLTLNEDGTAKVQQSGNATIVWQDPKGESVAPLEPGDPLSPYGTTLRVYVRISLGAAFEERVPMGLFYVTDTPSVEARRWRFGGRPVSTGDRVRLTLKDPFYRVQRNRFDVPGKRPLKYTVYAEIQRLTGLPFQQSTVANVKAPYRHVYTEEKLDAVYEMAEYVSALPYVTQDGAVSLRPQAWPEPVAEIVAADADEPTRELSPAGYTPWREVRRNLFRNPSFEKDLQGVSYNRTTGARVADGKGGYALALTRTADVSTDSYADITNMIEGGAAALKPNTTYTIQGTYTLSEPLQSVPVGATTGLGQRLSVFVHLNGKGMGAAEGVNLAGTRTVSLTFTTPGSFAGYNTIRLYAGDVASAPTRVRWDHISLVEGSQAGYLDGDMQTRDPLRRFVWTGTPHWSQSVEQVREAVPAVVHPVAARAGTLVGVSRGMSSDGVYNRVVVRSQGGKTTAVLAAAEVQDGPLAASGPFGRVPYFVSSQFITSKAQARQVALDTLARVSRPQSVIIDVEETFNPLREVGDVVTVRRLGESFLGRVVAVSRSLARTQTTSLVVSRDQ